MKKQSSLQSRIRVGTMKGLAAAAILLASTVPSLAATVTSSSFSYSLVFPTTGPFIVETIEDVSSEIGSFAMSIPNDMFLTAGDRNGWTATSVTIQLRMEDGDTGPSDFDFGRLLPVLKIGSSLMTLTEVPLNGFPNTVSATATNTGSIPAARGAALATLLSQIDSNPVIGFYILDTDDSGNKLGFYKSQASQFSLSITLEQTPTTAVPLPATLPLLLSALVATFVSRRRGH